MTPWRVHMLFGSVFLVLFLLTATVGGMWWWSYHAPIDRRIAGAGEVHVAAGHWRMAEGVFRYRSVQLQDYKAPNELEVRFWQALLLPGVLILVWCRWWWRVNRKLPRRV